MDIKNLWSKVPKSLVYVVLIFGVIIYAVSTYSAFNNGEVDLRTKFDMEYKNEATILNNVKVVVKQTAQVAIKNDSSFSNVVRLAMDPRKDGAGVIMKWVTESNPTLQFTEVSALYKNLQRVIESQRAAFVDQEKLLASVQREHRNFLLKFPNNFYNSLFGHRKPIEFEPIVTDEVNEAQKTRRDNNTEVF